MMKHLVSLLLLVSIFTTANAQTIMGDMNKDGDISMADANALVNAYAQEKPFEYVDGSDNSKLLGKWYHDRSWAIEFFADGTYDYGNGVNPGLTYKYYPDTKTLIFLTDGEYDFSRKATIADDVLTICDPSGQVSDVFNRNMPPLLVTSISLDEPDWEGQVGETLQLNVFIEPEDATIKTVTWTSSDESVATVKDGLITAIAEGNATITATTTDGSNLSAECVINVIPEQGTNIGLIDNTVYIPDMRLVAGGTMTVPVYLKNATDVCAVKCDIVLPKEMKMATDSGEYMWKTNEARVSVNANKEANLVDDAFRVGISTSPNDMITAADGILFNIYVNIESSLTGRQTIVIKNIELTDAEGKTIEADDVVCKVTVVPGMEVVEGHTYVNLGLPSNVLWATTNLGAEDEHEYGLLYAWGETEGYGYDTTDGRLFDLPSYKYGSSETNRYTKYVCNEKCGEVDNKRFLDDEDDAAKVNWGTSWSLPSYDDIVELCTYCTWTWGVYNENVAGYDITGPSGYTIFLPAAGRRWDDRNTGRGSYGSYWSYEAQPEWGATVKGMNFDEQSRTYDVALPRDGGRSIRPVIR